MSAILKRATDLAVASVALAAFAPLMAIVAAAIYATIGRPVYFRQVRPGYRTRPFTMLKFRTMSGEFGPDGLPLPDDVRLTRLGRFLRRTSLDELPQLWNVLKGELSLVGPRPLLTEYLPRYTPEQARRHDVKPGITGWAQVHGRNAISWEQKFAYDLWYVDHRSFWLDVRILAMTIAKVFAGAGVSEPGRATASPFRGTSGIET